jgi:hypothetical protein
MPSWRSENRSGQAAKCSVAQMRSHIRASTTTLVGAGFTPARRSKRAGINPAPYQQGAASARKMRPKSVTVFMKSCTETVTGSRAQA